MGIYHFDQETQDHYVRPALSNENAPYFPQKMRDTEFCSQKQVSSKIRAGYSILLPYPRYVQNWHSIVTLAVSFHSQEKPMRAEGDTARTVVPILLMMQTDGY